MLKNRTTTIIIIAVIFALAAGIFAFYRQNSQGQSANLDLISTILPAVQVADGSNFVQINAREYNQTLATVLNTYDYQKNQLPQVSWEADLNSALLHSKISQYKPEYLSQIINLVEQESLILNQDLYNSQITTQIKPLRKPVIDNSLSQNPYLATLLGFIIGVLLGSSLWPKKK